MRHDPHQHGRPADQELTPAERELESALGGLRLRTAASDPLSIAFDAGRETTRGQLARWRVACGAMAAALLVTVTSVPILRTTSPRSTASLVSRSNPVAASAVGAQVVSDVGPDAGDDAHRMVTPGALAMYFDLRDRVQDDGLKSLPVPPPVRADRPIPTAMSAPEECGDARRRLRGGRDTWSRIGGRS